MGTTYSVVDRPDVVFKSTFRDEADEKSNGACMKKNWEHGMLTKTRQKKEKRQLIDYSTDPPDFPYTASERNACLAMMPPGRELITLSGNEYNVYPADYRSLLGGHWTSGAWVLALRYLPFEVERMNIQVAAAADEDMVNHTVCSPIEKDDIQLFVIDTKTRTSISLVVPTASEAHTIIMDVNQGAADEDVDMHHKMLLHMKNHYYIAMTEHNMSWSTHDLRSVSIIEQLTLIGL